MWLQELTLCSVSFHSKPYLQIARQLLGEEAAQVRWIIAQNGPSEQLMGFDVIPGAPRLPAPVQTGTSRVSQASYYHAAGLHLALRHVSTRYALLLDPDFFIVRRLEEMVQHAAAKGLAFFGAPYAVDPDKPRYKAFPCAFCMLLDGQQLPLAKLDFTPDSSRKDCMADVGYRVYEKYGQRPSEAVLPASPLDTPTPHTRASVRSQYHLPDLDGLKCDQYFWQDKLFGLHFHMKLHLGRKAQTQDGQATLSREAMETTQRQLRAAIRVVETAREVDDL